MVKLAVKKSSADELRPMKRLEKDFAPCIDLTKRATQLIDFVGIRQGWGGI